MIEVTEKISLEEYVRRGMCRENELGDDEIQQAVIRAVVRDVRETFGGEKTDFMKLCEAVWDDFIAEQTCDD